MEERANPDRPEAHPYAAAADLLGEARPDEARSYLEAIESPTHPAAHAALLADAYYALGRFEEAAQRAQSALDAGWDTPQVRAILGYTLWKMGLAEAATAHLERAGPESGPADLALGWIAYRAGRFADAAAHTNRALERLPDDAAAQCLGLAARAAQGDPVARAALRRAWQDEGQLDAVEYLIADAQRRKAFHELDEMLPGLRPAAFARPRSATFVLRLVFERQGPEAALRLFDELPSSIQAAPGIVLVAGTSLWRLNRRGEAVATFERAFERDATVVHVARALAQAHLTRGRVGAAIRILARHVRATMRYGRAATNRRDS